MSGKQHVVRFLLTLCLVGFLTTPYILHAQEQNLNATFDFSSPSGAFNTLRPTNVANGILAGAAEAKQSAGDYVITSVVAGFAAVIGLISTLLSWIAAAILFIAGAFLDISISISTYGLSSMVNGNLRTVIDDTWRIFRDLVNIGFVFIMIYIAINLILRTETKQTKSAITNVIIAALLVNFSFFFAALVVDVSNQMALSIMKSIERQLGDQTVATFLLDKTDALTLSEIGGVFGNNSSVANSDPDKMLQWGIGGALSVVTLLVLAVVLFIGAFMLLGRTLAVIFLLITSPIGFIGKAFPMTKKMSNEWWDSLVGNAFALPIFLLFIFIAFQLMGGKDGGILAIVSSTNTTASVTSFSNMGSGGSTIADLVSKIAAPMIRYSIVIGLFLAALYAAKKMHSMGNQALAKLSGNITASVGGAALSTAAFAGRQSAGRLANWAADSERFKASAARNPLSALALSATRGIAGSSFDARSGKVFKGVASATGFSDKAFGDTKGKGGYAESLKTSREKLTTFAAENIGQLSDSNALVAPNKATLDAAELALRTAKESGASKATIGARTADVRIAREAYTASKNLNLTEYQLRLAKVGGSKLGKTFLPGRGVAGKTIAKALAKAQEDGKYDIIKALKAAKGDKKEE